MATALIKPYSLISSSNNQRNYVPEPRYYRLLVPLAAKSCPGKRTFLKGAYDPMNQLIRESFREAEATPFDPSSNREYSVQ